MCRALTVTVVCLLCLSLGACDEYGRNPDNDASVFSDTARVDDGHISIPGLDAAAGDLSDNRSDVGIAEEALSEKHPGDNGMASDNAVVWFEDFEAGSLAAISARYEMVRGNDDGGWELVTDTPNDGGFALALHATKGVAVDMFKQLSNYEEWWVRWYAKYEAGVEWHHNGVWVGGYNPTLDYPDPKAGSRPEGNDRFAIAVEPMNDGSRFDFYNYWMQMQSWQAPPIDDDGSAYWGNTLIHQNDFTVDAESWVCLEFHVRLNSDLTNGTGAVLEVWKNDVLVQRFDDTGPLGYWIRDKFCPEGVDDAACTNYPDTADEILNLQFRNTAQLQLNHFWPQNYDANGTVVFDQMVVATKRVGCMR